MTDFTRIAKKITLVLFLAQSLASAGFIAAAAINPILGARLASDRSFATLPTSGRSRSQPAASRTEVKRVLASDGLDPRVALVKGSYIVNSSQGGGSKDTYDMDLRIWVRNNATPTYYSPGVGFRCVRDK